MKQPNKLIGIGTVMVAVAIAIVMIFSSCATQSKVPVVKQFTIIQVHDGFFAAKNGKTVLLFGTQANDSAYIGKVINVSIGRK